MLKNAGAVSPREVDAAVLQSYVGKYRDDHGVEFNVSLKDGKLFAAAGGQQPLSLMAVGNTTFRPIAFDDYGVVTFSVEDGRTTGCVLKHGDGKMPLKRVEDQ